MDNTLAVKLDVRPPCLAADTVKFEPCLN